MTYWNYLDFPFFTVATGYAVSGYPPKLQGIQLGEAQNGGSRTLWLGRLNDNRKLDNYLLANKKSEMKALSFAILFTIIFASSIYGKEAMKNINSPQTEEEAERYFIECEAINVADLNDEKAPMFKDFIESSEAPLERTKVDTKTTAIGRTYRTVLQKGIASGPNYAGHYAIVIWGCGSSCSTFAVVNLKTGKIIVPNGIRSVSGLHLDNTVKQFLPDGQHGYWGYRYKLDSRLLVLVGMLNENENREGAYYFVMNNNILKQVHQTQIVKKCTR